MRNRACIVILASLQTVLVACGGTQPGGNENQNQVSTAVCGDGVLDPGEACDDGADNSDVTPDACRSNCRSYGCGDGVVDSGEACDEGGANSDRISDACRTSCLLPSCGDGVVDSGEQCDDANSADGDGCSASCQIERNFECSGSPSLCVCQAFFHGDHCRNCVVFVDRDVMSVSPTGQSWETAFPTVQAGVDQAQSIAGRCDVWVAEGRYPIYRFGVGNSLRLRTGVSLYGGFSGTESRRDDRDWEAHPTILDGLGPDGEQGVFHVVTAEATEDATLDGFVITGGTANGNLEDASQRGGGVYAYASQLTLAHLAVVGNQAAGEGGGVYLYASAVEVTDGVFLGNMAAIGGAVCLRNAALEFSRVTISHNVVSRTGSAVQVGVDSTMAMDSSVVYGNISWIFLAPAGTAIRSDGKSTIRNTTFVYNFSRLDESAFRGWGTLTNCVFYRNEGTAVDLIPGETTYSIHQENHAGEGNQFGGDPMLVSLPRHAEPITVFGGDAFGVQDETLYQVGDVIELGGDDVTRTVTAVHPAQGGAGPEVDFQPPLADADGLRVLVEVWDAGTAVLEPDLHPAASSPCIDTGDDASAPPTDRDGQTWQDAPGEGTTGVSVDRGAYDFRP